MNNSRRVAVAVTLLAAGFISALGPVCEAQTQGLTPVSPPATGTFYSLQLGDDWPPLPFLPFDVAVYDLGGGIFAYDDLTVDYVQSRSARQAVMLNGENDPPDPEEGGDPPPDGDPGSPGFNYTTNDLWLGILTVTNSSGSSTVTLTIHAPDTNSYDLFRTFELVPSSITNALWRWVGRGTNAQSLSFSNVHCPQAFYVLGSRTDSDTDGLTDAFEMLVSKTSPATNRTYYSTGLTDLEWWLRSNVLVNDPEQDCANEQNSQFEPTIAVVGSNVIVAWVDSNQGVYEFGANSRGYLTNYTPRFVGYAVSRNGGVTFEDKGVPPLCTNNPAISSDDGDAGDPVLAVDQASGIVYLVGTSMRNSTGFKGIPLWKSTDAGGTFGDPITVRADITSSDKPWIAVDNAAGTGQHDLYLTCSTVQVTLGLWLTMSTNGALDNWTTPLSIRAVGVSNVTAVQSAIPLIGPDHAARLFWFERTGTTTITNWIKMCGVLNRGTTLGDIHTVVQLATTNTINGNLELKRSNGATNTDTFRAFPLPAPAINAAKTNHLYVAWADKGTNANDKADVFFISSTNGGTTWTNLVRVNTDATTNDQWMPVEFKISSASFPPVFAGTDTNNTPDGHYDPVYPPGGVNLHWWYPDWPLTNAFGEPNLTPVFPPGTGIEGHVGEYNGAWAESEFLNVAWTDYRLPAIGISFARNQSDVRFVRLAWP